MTLKTTLREYQAEALRRWHMRLAQGFGLFMEQRTGKTLVALAVIDAEKPARILIVTPLKGIDVWQAQLQQHLFIDWACEVRVMNFEQVVKARSKLRRWATGGMVIVDESHRIKRRGSTFSRALRSIGKKALYRLALTGTPIAQGIHDAWAQLDFLDPTILGPWTSFQDRYCVMGGYRGKKVVGFQNVEEFQRILHEHSYRLTLKEAQQGRATLVRYVRCPVTLGSERCHYHELEDALITYVNEEEIQAPIVITQAMKLQQLTGGWIVGPSGTPHQVGTAKEAALLRLLETFDSGPHVICVRFIHELEHLGHLGESQGKRVQTISGAGNFYTPEDPPDWILIQIQAGVAIDLSQASRIIFYSWDYSYINYEQLRFRIL
ncbi:MAG: SNF2-related protein, partial [Chromatiaceae bacterium]|nr:SNF2-related protein [Candidatus Thioaporhodococcus sediminis]